MAAIAAPLPGNSSLVAEPQFQETLQRCRSLTEKILDSIADVHKSYVHIKTLQLNSTENSNLQLMASTIGISSPPVLKALSENFSLETSMERIFEGLQQHQALLDAITSKLEVKDPMNNLKADLRDLGIQIRKMLKMLQKDVITQKKPTAIELQLPGDYEVQVATHLTLVQLQAFGNDINRCLRSLIPTNKETES